MILYIIVSGIKLPQPLNSIKIQVMFIFSSTGCNQFASVVIITSLPNGSNMAFLVLNIIFVIFVSFGVIKGQSFNEEPCGDMKKSFFLKTTTIKMMNSNNAQNPDEQIQTQTRL